jgi:hypothetical protein
MYVEVLRVMKYACRACEGSGDEDKPAVRTGKVPANIMPGSIATPDLLSFIFTRKYCDYIPYYRQEAAFGRVGAPISRQNMSNWQIKSCAKIEPLLELVKEQVTAGETINMDETEMLVMGESGRDNKTKSRMWLARGGPPGRKAAWYEYHTTREANYVYNFLSDWATDGERRFLQTDGYAGYDSAIAGLKGITRVACLAHIRRKFYEASKLGVKSEAAESALAQIQNIYKIERKWRTLLDSGIITEKEFIELREHESLRPLVKFHLWQRKVFSETPPSSALGKAAKYALEEWPAFVHYLEHWELTPDNNAAERAIRPFVMGRKNWVMSGSPDGAKTSCQLFSLIETAKLNGKNPYKYLTAVFTRAAEMSPSADWSKLLPWNLDC